MGILQIQRTVLVAAIVGALTVTCVDAFCASPEGPNVSSYGHKFLIPFPEVSVGQGTGFTFQLILTNPNNEAANVYVTMTNASNVNSTTIYSVIQSSSEVVAVPQDYMMQGEGTFHQHVQVTCAKAIGVQVLGNQEMDGYVALPVGSWDKDYWPVTFWVEFGGKAVMAIIADVAVTVTINIADQDSNHLSLFDTISPARSETLDVTLDPGQVYQLTRNYDISGCHVTATDKIGVVSGTDFSWIGEGSRQGSFYDWVPGRSTLGTDFVVPLTPGRQNLGDLLQVMAILEGTHVVISTDFKRLILNSGKSIIRKFTNDLVQVQSDQPVVVVKFSQSGGIQGLSGHPTMTYIPPTDLYLANTVYIVPEVVGFTGMSQHVIAVGTSTAVQCISNALGVTKSQNSLYGTNMATQKFAISPGDGHLEFACYTPTDKLSIYNYFTSEETSFQVVVAYSQQTINPTCLPTTSSPGDHIDNDCDGERDEDTCLTANPVATTTDCEPQFSGYNMDVFGTSFTVLIPEHCSSAESINLLVTSETQEAIDITVTTPLVSNLINIIDTKSFGTYVTHIALMGNNLQASGSHIFNTTLVITASLEISATLEMSCPGSADISAVSTRLIPDEGLGVEYFAITVCKTGSCFIQISAPHAGTTSIKIRVRLANLASFLFMDLSYGNGDLICVQLEQYESAQITADQGDLTGTHILSDKPISVMSGGKLTNFIHKHFKDGLLEMLPPVQAWGITHYLVQTPVITGVAECSSFACKDYMKIVASENDINVKLIHGAAVTTHHILHQAGDFILLMMPDVFVKVDASGPVLILQVTQELFFGLEVSGSLVIPPRQWYRGDVVPVPSQAVPSSMNLYLLLVSNQVGIDLNDVTVDGSSVAMTEVTNLNGSYYRDVISTSNDIVSVVFKSGTSVGGQLHAVGGGMGNFYPLAFLLDTINEGCAVTRGSRGDGVDNDCDGHVDEEDCVFNNLADDSDLDGMLNEDCASDVAQTTILSTTEAEMSSTQIVMTSAILVISSEILPTSSGMLPTSSEMLPTSSELLPTSSEMLPTSSEMLPTSSELLPTSSEMLPTSSELLPTSSELLPTSSDMLPISTENLLASSEILPVSSEILPVSSEMLPIFSSIVPTSNLELALSSETPALSSAVDFSSSFSTTESDTAQPSSSAVPVSNAGSGTMCSCQCPNDLLSTPLDSSQIEQMTSSIQKELYVNEREVSASKRKYISVNDQRPSAQTVGYFGVCVVAVTFSGIFLMDIGSLAKDIIELVNACKRGE